MELTCLYPESYAVVCAASRKSPELVAASGMEAFSQDLCSYSLLSFGAEHYDKLPYGGLPEPDMLIAVNNQCGTTLPWFKLLAQQKNIPLFVIDYPAPAADQPAMQDYIIQQYESLVEFVKTRTGSDLNTAVFSEQVEQSKKACQLWTRVHQLNQSRPTKIEAHKIVDALFPIVTSKGATRASEYYEALLSEYTQSPAQGDAEAVRLLWHGYPMWFLPKKFPGGFDNNFQIVLNDYTLWWSLNYPDDTDDMKALAVAYSDTWLNRPLDRKIEETCAMIADYSIDGVICHVNRSCRRALADIQPLRDKLRQLSIPSVTIESDMADPRYYSDEQVKLRIESFKDMLTMNR
jgi:benzoyl-CoA reductase/2-hydroxyglutaryl-CoA dehydratase subunit BcrC/BadD/HgdB